MKLYVKRDQFHEFKKGRIELETSLEWSTIEIALHESIKSDNDAIKFYKELQEKYNEDKSEEIQYYVDRIARIEKMLDELSMANEYSWEENNESL